MVKATTTARVRLDHIGIHFAALTWLQIDIGEPEVLAIIVSIQAPAGHIDRRASLIGDNGIFIRFVATLHTVKEDIADLHIARRGRWWLGWLNWNRC